MDIFFILSDKKIVYFYKRNVKSKQEKLEVCFTRESILHLIGISYYDINERELEIIELIAKGYSNKEIASELFLSEGTVRNYLSSILDKLQLRDRTQVAVFYYQHKNTDAK